MKLTEMQLATVIETISQNAVHGWYEMTAVEQHRIRRDISGVIFPALEVLPDGITRNELKARPDLLAAATEEVIIHRARRELLNADHTREQLLNSVAPEHWNAMLAGVFDLVALALNVMPDDETTIEELLARWNTIDLDSEYQSFFS